MTYVEEGRSATHAGVVGRESELALLDGFLQEPGRRHALVISGEAGIGKTTMWEAAVERARGDGMRVLVARPSGAEAGMSFAALIDLLEHVDVGALPGVPAPQRLALEIALLRAKPVASPPEPHAIALGLLNGLRTLALRERLVVALDDIQWIDTPSAEALAFAARRLNDEAVAFLLARRPGPQSAIELALEPRGLEHLDVGPLSFSALRRLLSERLGLVLSRQLLRRIVQATMGNPLFVLEVGRTLRARGIPRADEDIPVPDRVEDLLGTRVARLAPALRRLLLAIALSADLRLAELESVVGADVIEDAADAGLLLVDGERVRASHPLLGAAAKARSRPRERRELHRALASAVSDGELRALHLALATERSDARLARTLVAAAHTASVRGDRLRAVTLSEHALRLTPPDTAVRSERLLDLAGYLEAAGELRRMADLLGPQIESIPAGTLRARAWLMLSETAESAADYERDLDLALAECEGNAGLRAHTLAARMTSAAAVSVSRLADAEAWGLSALPGAEREGGEASRWVLYALGWVSAMRGRPIDELCARFVDASETAFYIVHSPVRVAAQRLVWRGETTRARTELERLLALADERGEPSSYALARLHLCELELRVGGWVQAARLLDEWEESSEAELLHYPMYERCRALLAAGRGDAAEALDWAAKTIEHADATSSRWDWLEALRARGMTALLEQDPARAVESLRLAWEHTCREGVEDPGVFPVAPDLVEALVECGEQAAASRVTARLRELSEQQEHPWGLATARRCEAVVRLATGAYAEREARALADAAEQYGRLGLRFDRARSLLSLGRAQRRTKKWGPARESLHGAIAAFEELGSAGWATRARSELARTGGRRPRPSGELTATEQQVVVLAAEGRTNKEIAHSLSLAVHTVEVHLSRAYAKLGVGSRSQLAARLSIRA